MAIEVKGGNKLAKQLDKLPDAVLAGVQKQIIKGATMIQASAVESIQRGPKTGVVYDKGKGISHQASAPGEAPASDTGNLARRIEIELSADKLRADIGVTNLLFTPYARRLELGDKGSAKKGKAFIRPRPFMRPAYNKNIKAIRAGIRRAVAAALK